MCPKKDPKRARSGRRLEVKSLDDRLVYGVLDLFTGWEKEDTPLTAQAIADLVNPLFGVNLSREQLYQIVREGRSRRFIAMIPPHSLALAQRVIDYFRLRPSEQEVVVVDVDGEALATTDALAVAAARLLKQILLGLADGDQIEIGLGTGPVVLRTMKKLGELLRAENHRRSVFVVRPIEPAGYSVLYPGTLPLSFARYLETPWTEVVIEPWQETTGLRLAVLDAHESEPRDFPPGFEPQDLVLLAGPGELRSVRPWFETLGRFTHAVLDPKTAAGLVEVESKDRQT